MLKEKAVIASLLVLVLSTIQSNAETVDVRLRIDNRRSDEKFITKENLTEIKQFIIKKGLHETYSQMFNNNPAYHTKSFVFYLNPDSGQKNINCEIEKSDFQTLVIRAHHEKNQYYHVEFSNEFYVYITVDWPTKDLAIAEIRNIVTEALEEILTEVEKEPTHKCVMIRVTNTGNVELKDVLVRFPSQTEKYGNIAPGQATAYRRIEKAYSYAYIRVAVDGNDIVLQPVDYVGEKLLPCGKYTYALKYNPKDVYGPDKPHHRPSRPIERAGLHLELIKE